MAFVSPAQEAAEYLIDTRLAASALVEQQVRAQRTRARAELATLRDLEQLAARFRVA